MTERYVSVEALVRKCSVLAHPSIPRLREKIFFKLLRAKRPDQASVEWIHTELKEFIAAEKPESPTSNDDVSTLLIELIVLDFKDFGPLRWILDLDDWVSVTIIDQKILVEMDENADPIVFPLSFINKAAARRVAEKIAQDLSSQLNQRMPICIGFWQSYAFECFASPVSDFLWFRLKSKRSTSV